MRSLWKKHPGRFIGMVMAAVLTMLSLGITASPAFAASTLTPTPTPTIAGTARVGLTLTAAPGTWGPAPVTLAYKWTVGTTAVSGATSSTYTPVAADVGKAVKVTVTGSKSGYTTVAKTSVATANVAAALAFTSAPTPTISGTPKVGTPLTAVAGTWAPAPVTLTYQWTVGTTAVSGAITATYTPVTADVGKTVKVSVTGTEPGYATTTKTSAVTAAIGALSTLTATPTPTISGTPRVGLTLTAVPGTWAPAPVTLAYQWYLGTTAVAGATNSTYTPVAGDVSKTVKVAVTGSEPGYTSVTKTSATTSAVAAAQSFTASPVPTISGSAIVGLTLTATAGTWAPAPVTLTYQWKANGVAISGATSSTYLPVVGDIGKPITVTVTGSEAGYVTTGRTSTATGAVIANATFTSTPVPVVNGTAQSGLPLTVDAGTWAPAPVTLAYAWFTNGTAISGATAGTYTPTDSDVGKALTIKVTGTEPGFSTVTQTSAATPAVAATTPFTDTSAPDISGTPAVGQPLTAATSAWSPAAARLSYIWFANGVEVVGAVGSNYTPSAADLGKVLSVTVTGSTPGYTTTTRTSTGTAAVAPRPVPDVPFLTSVQGVGLGLLVAWTPNDSIDLVTTYTLTATPVAGSTVPGCTTPTSVALDVLSSSSSSYIAGLCAGVAYAVKETATNSVGTSASTASSNPVVPLPAQVPGGPLIVTTTPRAGSLTVTWTAPGYNGGSALTGYTLTATAGASTLSTNAASTDSSATITGLITGTTYSLKVVAKNSVGSSDPALGMGIPVAAYVPSSVPSFTAQPDGSGNIVTSWQPSIDNGGSAINGYVVSYQRMMQSASGVWSPVSGAVVHTLNVSSTATTATAAAASFESAASTYQFSVTAVNGIGSSTPSVSPSPISPTVQATSRAIVLTTATVAALAGVEPNGLAWAVPAPAQALTIAKGAILVAPAAGLLPHGALLQVDSVTNDGVNLVIGTSQATLQQAFSNLSVGTLLNPLTSGTTGAPAAKADAPGFFGSKTATFTPAIAGVTVAPNNVSGSLQFDRTFDFDVDLDGHPLGGCGQHSASPKPCLSLSVHGKYSVTPSMSLGLTVNQNAAGVPDGVSMSSAMTTELASSVEFSGEGSYEVRLGELSGTPIDIQVGPIPVIVLPKIPLFLKVSGSAAVGFTTSITTGGSLEWSSLDPNTLRTQNLSKPLAMSAAPVVGFEASGTLAVGLELQPEILLYDLSGPNIEADLELVATLSLQSPVLHVGPRLSLKAGVAFDLFGLSRANLNATIAQVDLGSYDLTTWAQSAAFTIAPQNVTVAPLSSITFTATRLAGGAQPVTWSLRGGESGDSITSAGIFTASAVSNRTVTVVATDSAGLIQRTAVAIGGTFDPPSDVRFQAKSGTPFAATVSWAPPASTGGSAVASYRVVTDPASGKHVTTSTSLDLTGLKSGTYIVTVFAINAAGITSPPATAAFNIERDGTVTHAFTSASTMRATAPSGTPNGQLLAVSCAPAGGCAAVGYYLDSAGKKAPLVESNASGTWQLVPLSAIPGPGSLTFVSCMSVTSCTAVGGYKNSHGMNVPFAATLSGTTWSTTVMPVPTNGSAGTTIGMSSLACDAPGSCTLVGISNDINGNPRIRAFIETLSGGVWSWINAPLPDGGFQSNGTPWDSYLQKVVCGGPGKCVAIGWTEGNLRRPILDVLSGGTWSDVPNPFNLSTQELTTARYEFTNVSCASGDSCVVGGKYSDGIYHYDTGTSDPTFSAYLTLNGGAWTADRYAAELYAAGGYEIGVLECVTPGDCRIGTSDAAVYSNELAQHIGRLSGGDVVDNVDPPLEAGATWGGLYTLSCVTADRCAGMTQSIYPDGSQIDGLDIYVKGSWTWVNPEFPGDQSPLEFSSSEYAVDAACTIRSCYVVGVYIDNTGHQAPFIDTYDG